MRGRVILTCVSLLFLSSTALPQCNLTPIHSAPYRASYLDVAVDGTDLWAATSYGVQLLDRTTDPPRIVASMAVPGTTRVVRPVGGIVYTGSGSSLWVVRRSGSALQLVRSIDAGATVNDIVATPLSLYVGTANGLQQYDLLDPLRPVRTSAVFLTTGANVTSLALAGSTLYAADGDSSVEVFDITVATVPQRMASFESLPRSLSIEATATRLFVSDGLQTDLFFRTGSAPTRAARLPFGVTSLAALSNDVAFVAGTDRRLHAFDFSVAETPVELFATDIAPTGGTINRISALQIAGGRLYAAAGDAGLSSFDVSSFVAPYPVRSYPSGSTNSVSSLGGKLYAARDAGGLSEFSISQSGQLTPARQWDARVHTVHDGANALLLTSSGSTLFYWTLASLTPTLVTSVTLRRAVKSAVVIANVGYAVLDDRTFWSADLAQPSPVPQQITLSGIQPSFIARSGTAVAIADLRDDGTTSVHYFPRPDFSAPPQTVFVPGVATSGLALSAGRAAVFTFLGVTVTDFNSGTSAILPQSNTALARKLGFSGSTLLVLTDSAVNSWNTTTRTKLRSIPIPVEGVSLHVGEETATNIAGVATTAGVASVSFNAVTQTPVPIEWRLANAYYKKMIATSARLYLFDGRGIDIYSTLTSDAPRYVASVRLADTIDLAASSERLFTLSSGRIVKLTSFTRDGDLLSQSTVEEGSEDAPPAIAAVRGAPWVSISRGCRSGGCEKKTIVLDPQSLVRTSTMIGATVDVASSGNRAYAITDLPAEIRSIDVSDALHPSVTSSRPTEGSPPPVSIALGGGTVYVIGERLYAYSQPNLTKNGELLDSYQPDPAGGTSYIDQHVAIDGNCGVMTGRKFSPQFFTLPQWSSISSAAAPAATKSLAFSAGRLYLLTDYSVEVWSSGATNPGRKRATR